MSGDNVPPWFSGYTRRRDVDDIPASQIRCSDAERHEMVDKLSKHFADGRLDQIEFDDRMGRAMAAKSRGDLAGLLDDLPPLAGEDTSESANGPTPTPGRPARPRCVLLPLRQLMGVELVAMARLDARAPPWLHLDCDPRCAALPPHSLAPASRPRLFRPAALRRTRSANIPRGRNFGPRRSSVPWDR